MKRVLILLLAVIVTGALLEGSAMAEETGKEYQSGDFTYVVLEDGTAEITLYTGRASELSIPGAIDGRAVSSIGGAPALASRASPSRRELSRLGKTRLPIVWVLPAWTFLTASQPSAAKRFHPADALPA